MGGAWKNSQKLVGLLTLNPELRIRVDGAVFVLSHTLVHARILQGQVTDLQHATADLHTVLCEVRKSLLTRCSIDFYLVHESTLSATTTLSTVTVDAVVVYCQGLASPWQV